MQLMDGELVVSATDLTRFAACRHSSTLDRELALGLRPVPAAAGAELELLWRRGRDHEAAYLQQLRDRGLLVHEITTGPRVQGREALMVMEQQTVAAMAAGAEVIYQAAFFDGRWRGHADFLLRRDDLPGRWGWGYDVADTKLARRLKVPAVLQMAVYAERLTALQGTPPRTLVVVTGDGAERDYSFQDCAAYARRLAAELLDFLDQGQPTSPEPVRQCGQCRWQPQCRAEWTEQDHLSLVGGIRTTHAAALRAAGLRTVAEFASARAEDLPAPLGGPVGHRLLRQARLQVRARAERRLPYEVLDPEPGRGLALLPEPSPGDLFFDIEGDPFVGEHGLEYLFGVLGRGGFTAHWATSLAQERAAFENLVDQLMAAWAEDPRMHIYHYAPYERLRLQALSGRYGTRGAQVDRLLRGGRLIDLYAVVRQGLRIGTASYSLKKLEALYWGQDRDHRGEAAVNDAMGSVVAFETWLAQSPAVGASIAEDPLLEGIRVYNEEDCRSTQALRDWLEGVRAAAGGDQEFTRPALADGEPSAALAAATSRTEQLRGDLLGMIPAAARAESAERTPEQEAIWLMAMLLDWHRREALPDWWDHFQRLTLTDDQLIDDPTALGGLGAAEPTAAGPPSTTWRLAFPPQETKLGSGERRWVDPRTGAVPGIVLDVRPDEGWMTLRRRPAAGPPQLTAMVPGTPPQAAPLEQRLAELAGWVLRHGIDAPLPDWRPARDLLLRRPPGAGQGPLRRGDESATDAVVRCGSGLSGGLLAVQGPPGTGKTFAATALVLSLLAQGRRVGVTAFSHTAIGNLLSAVAVEADRRGVVLRAVQKAEDHKACAADSIAQVTQNSRIADLLDAGAVDLVAGTPWLFARPELAERLDTVVVDEAGQLSLANVLALSHAAPNLVLFGDPRQLSQPVKGTHPRGAEASALGHLLGDHATIAPEAGLLLDTTYRMHPLIADFLSGMSYDGRLRGVAGLECQEILAAGDLGGSGLRWIPLRHKGNGTVCGPEAEQVAALVAGLLAGGTWRDRHDVVARLTPADVLVIAPYNQQVHRVRHEIRSRLPGPDGEAVQVGTVDAFQGRQAPVVIYSLTSSSAADAPRGVEFLLDPHRFTVAVSRARALVAVVGSPELLRAPVARPEQLRRVNALCSYVELAESSAASAPGDSQVTVSS